MTPYTTTQWDDLGEQVFTFARQRTLEAGSMFVRDALTHFAIDFATFDRVRARLLLSGRLVDLGRGLGLAAVGSDSPVMLARRLAPSRLFAFERSGTSPRAAPVGRYR